MLFLCNNPVRAAVLCTLRGSGAIRAIAATIALTFAVPAGAATPNGDSSRQHQHALELARAGNTNDALVQLAELVAANPGNAAFRYDYATVLGWAQRDDQVLQLFKMEELPQLPPYALETVGKSARNLRRYDLAEHVYRLALEKDATRLPSQIGLGYALSENGKPQAAIDHLHPLVAAHPDNVEVLETLAAAQSTAEQHAAALASYERILALQPENRNAKRSRIFTAARLGATHRAYELAQADPELVSDAERHTLALDDAATLLRWDSLTPPSNAAPYREADQAITLIERTLDESQGNDGESAALRRRAQRDLVSAYQRRNRSAEAIATYEALKSGDSTIPTYATLDAADAYLTAREPERARALYNDVLTKEPTNQRAKHGLFYAAMDAGEYDEGRRLADQFVADQASGSPSERQSARSLAALSRAWSDDLADAQRRLEELASEAPYNAELHEQLGSVYLNRGWPRAALDELAIARGIDPQAMTPRLSEADARLRYSDYSASEQLLYEVENEDASSPAVKRQRRAWELHSMRELRIDVMSGTGNGAQIGSDSLDADAYIYSAPIRDRFRVYGHGHYAQASFAEGDADYTRYGAGIDFRSPSVEWNAELSSGPSPYSDIGVMAAARWHLDDHWTANFGVDSYSNDVPLRGRYNEKVDGKSADVGIEYRWHESRSLGLSSQYIDMSDDNQRTSIGASLYQRLVNRPTYKLDGWLRMYASRNTRDNASYFNPESDFSPSVTLRNEWLGWRHYDRAFLHRLSLSAGTYRQTGYGANALWVASYEHDWLLNDRTEVLYGISRSMHPYDGIDEFETRLYATLVWKF